MDDESIAQRENILNKEDEKNEEDKYDKSNLLNLFINIMETAEGFYIPYLEET